MATEIEGLMYNGMLEAVGDPIYIGLLVLAFFVGFVILQNTSLPLKLLISVGAVFLASAFIPFFGLLIGLIAGVILYAGIMRAINK